MSARLEILTRSLARKLALMDSKISAHFDAVKAANGQPLNDKRNGAATLKKWSRQNDSIRNLSESIDKTKAAIEREKAAIHRVQAESDQLPQPIRREIASGLLTQWRKHPRTFFVAGVDKARIVLLGDGRLAHRYTAAVTDPDQRKTFARTYNALATEIASATKDQELQPTTKESSVVAEAQAVDA